MKLHPKSFLSAASLLIGGFIGASALVTLAQTTSTWTGPSAVPPNGDVAAPINVSGSTQAKLGNLVLNGLSVNAATILSGVVQIATGNPQPGDVLTAQDASGTVAWGTVSSGGSSSGPTGPVFIAPVTVASFDYTPVGWTTVTIPASAGIPTTAKAVILQAQVVTYNEFDPAEVDVRAASGGPSYILLTTGDTGSGTLAAGAQGIFPVSNNGGTLQFDYQYQYTGANPHAVQNTISVIGYIL